MPVTPPGLTILYEDNHCLAVAKPAGWLSTHYEGHEETLDRLVKAYLKEKHAKPGNVFLGVVHRLDRPASGVLLFARTSKAAARLAQQFREGTVRKTYWAVVEGELEPAGTLEDELRKDEAAGRVVVVPAGTPGARRAVLDFKRLAGKGGLTWLEVQPRTGRKHQIRVQLASRGRPIYGDRKYGSAHPFGQAIALHARMLTFQHPTRQEPITLTAPVPEAWRARFAGLVKEERMKDEG
jgi:23S rRNA pseudouridine1911/1915/1917 synthase